MSRASTPLRAPASSVANLWQPLGPGTVLNGPATGRPRVVGRINALSVRDAGDRLYAATANGGVWFSGDGGGTWESLGGFDATDRTGLERSAHRNACGAIAVAFGTGTAPDVIYVGTGEVTHPYNTSAASYMSSQTGRPFAGVGILRGERPAAGGPVTWVREARNLMGSGVYRVALEPGGTGVVAATLTGLYQRPAAPGVDVDWVRPSGAPFDTLDVECTDVLWTEADGARPARLWVWVQSGPNAGLWFRAGAAGDFTRVETPGAHGRRAVLAASTPPDQIWVLADQPDDATTGPTAARSARVAHSAVRSASSAAHDAHGECVRSYESFGEGFRELLNGEIVPVRYGVSKGVAYIQGDIRLGTVAEVEAFSSEVRKRLAAAGTSDPEAHRRVLRGNAIAAANRRWPGGILPWTAQAAVRERVVAAMAHWESKTRICFVERVPANSALYPNWIDFQTGDVCDSSVGMQNPGAQVTHLGSECAVGNTIHEIGHSVGLAHEHTRTDRNLFVSVQQRDIDSVTFHVNFDPNPLNFDVGAYDYGSIMHYSRTGGSPSGQEVITPLGGQAIGQRESLSPGDIATVRALYPGLVGPLLFRVTAAGAAAPAARVVLGLPDVAQQQGYDSLALAIDPSAPNRVVLGGHDLATTTRSNLPIAGDAAIAVADVSVVSNQLQYGGAINAFTMLGIGVPAGVHDLKYSNGGTRLWVACDGGLFRSDRVTSSVGFFPRHEGIQASEIVQLGAHPSSEGHLVASLRGDALVERATSSTWRLLDHEGARGLAFDPLDLRRFIVQRGPGRYASSDGALTGDEVVTRGAAVARAEQADSAPYSVPALIAHRRGSPPPAPPNLRQLLVGTNRLWYSENFGSTWVTLPTASDPLPANTTQDRFEEPITACLWQSPDVAWVLGESRVVRYARTPGSEAGGGPGTWASEIILRRTVKPKKDTTSAEGPVRRADLWNDIAINLDPPPAAGEPAASHGPKGALYLGTSGLPGDNDVDTLWWFDGTSRWWPTGLRRLGTAAPVTAIVCDPAAPNDVYVGTTVGVWKGVRSQVGAADPIWAFTPLLNGLPEAPVQSLALFSDGDVRLLRAGIAARGVWELRLDTADVPSLTYLRVHDDDLRYRAVTSTLGRDGTALRSWHGSPDIRPRTAPDVPVPAPASLPWTRATFLLDLQIEALRRFQAALRARTGDLRVRPTGEWDEYFDEILRDLGAPPSALDPSTVSIDAAFWALSMVPPHATAEPWGPGAPSEADLLEFTPELAEGTPDQASCSVLGLASRVDIVLHQRGSTPVDGANVRVTLLRWIDPRDSDAATWSDATTWPLTGNVPWTAAVNQVLNSPSDTGTFTLPDGWDFVGTTPATRRRTLAGQTLDSLRTGVATFDLNLTPVRRDRLIVLVAVVRVDTDITLAPLPLRELTLSNPHVAVRSFRVNP